ncbi:Thymus-specific serine protease [Chamberlinius hualienensis]
MVNAKLITLLLFITLSANVYAKFDNQFRQGRKLSKNFPEIDQSRKLPPPQWFTQRLDHFNDAETRTWQQRYFVNDTFYVPGGPVFVMIGGEGPVSPIWNVEGAWIENAQQFQAICIQVEHRYYGESHPTADLSIDNLRYLSSEQALADLANFRTDIEQQYNLQGAKWIFFGGSYSGSLAAWLRLKYPHLVDGAVATSGPLYAEINFIEYLGVVQKSLSDVSSTCNPAITNAVNQIDALLAQGQSGWSTLTSQFRLCSTLDGSNSLDVANFYSYLCGNFEGVVQYNKDNREFQGSKATNITIDTICGIMDDSSIGAEIDRYAAVNSLLLDAYDDVCLDYGYNDMITYLQGETWDSPGAQGGARQWIYQTCTEYGWYQSSDLEGQPFGAKFPIDFWVNQCADIYGAKFNATLLQKGVDQTNTDYGGYNISVTKVIFPNGSVDPWHALGVLQDISNEAKAVYIQGTAHCADMYPSSPNDPPQLVQARDTIRQEITTWLAA